MPLRVLAKRRAGGRREDHGAPTIRARGAAEAERPRQGRAEIETIRTTRYDYRDASGEVRYRKERYDREDGTKDCKFFWLDGTPGLGGQPHLLYCGERLADLSEGAPVWVVEGEECAKRMWEHGAIAVTGDSGWSSKWLPAHAELLRGLKGFLRRVFRRPAPSSRIPAQI
jgi:hypothetical protein